MQYFTDFLANFWQVILDAGPWLLVGLLTAGLIKAFVPDDWMGRWLGKRGFGSVFRAALVGTPLPLCSCGVLPAALSIRKQGASRGATVSFLVATPVNGVDSITVSYALLGPFLAIVRPIVGIGCAIIAGLLSELSPKLGEAAETGATEKKSCCGAKPETTPEPEEKSCCADGESQSTQPGIMTRLAGGMRYAMSSILDEIALWMLIGLIAAAVVTTFVPPDALASWGSGVPAMLLMIAIGVPMYICATASIPLATSLLLAGVSPGTVLVFLLAGPATNIGSLAVVRKNIGTAATIAYLVGLCGGAIGFGLATDWVVNAWQISIETQVEHSHGMLPAWVSIPAAVLLVILAIRPLRRFVFGLFGSGKQASEPAAASS